MNGIQPSGCVRARQWISLALDRELSEFERFLMEDHVKRCADCSVFERDARTFTVGMRSTPLESLSAPVWVGKLGQPGRRFGRLRLANVVPVAVAAASVFLATTFLPDRAGFVGEEERPAAIADPMTVNELVLEPRRRNLRQQAQPAVRRALSDIGAVTASLSGPTN